MAINNGLEKAFSDTRVKIFFSFIIAFVIAATVTIDQQSKNLIKLLLLAGLLATLFNWRAIKRHIDEFEPGSILVLFLYLFGILLAILANPINGDTFHDLRIMSIGFTSVLIWSLMISIRFRADYFWWGILSCALSTGVYALIQVGMHDITYRATGSSGKWIMFGDVAMMSGLLSLTAMAHFRRHSLFFKVVPIIAFLMGVLASILSGSRGGWLFLPLALIIVFYFLHVKGLFALNPGRVAVLVTLLCAGLATVITFTNATERIQIAYQDIHGYFVDQTEAAGKTSLGQRFEMWKAAIIALEQAPLFGIGPGQFDDHLARLAEQDRVNKQVAQAWKDNTRYHPHSHAHNEYLNTLATRGVVGLGTTLLLFFYLLSRFIRLTRSDQPTQASLGLAGVLLLSGYLVFSLSESVLYHAMTANFFFLCLVSLLYLSRRQPDSPTPNRVNS